MNIIEFDRITIRIPFLIIDKFLEFKQDTHEKPESGGCLIGYYLDEYSFVLTDITVPTKYDHSSRFNFTRSKMSIQDTLSTLFIESFGKKIYLGEWHTHPQNLPIPSTLDNLSIIKQAKFNQLNSDTIFMIIIGNTGFHISLVKNKKIICQKGILYNQMMSV